MKMYIDDRKANMKDFYGEIEYQMPKEFAQSLLKKASRQEKPQDVLTKYVNDNCGLLGCCVRVVTI